MACGRAVYVYDMFGGDGWVTPETYAAMEADHFAGQATDRVIGVDGARAATSPTTTARMGTVNRDLVLQHHSARDHVDRAPVRARQRRPKERPPAPLRELARLTALQWSWERFAREAQHEQAVLHERLLVAERVAEEWETTANAERERAEILQRAADWAVSLEADLKSIHASRAWRLAARYRRWRDRLLRVR